MYASAGVLKGIEPGTLSSCSTSGVTVSEAGSTVTVTVTESGTDVLMSADTTTQAIEESAISGSTSVFVDGVQYSSLGGCQSTYDDGLCLPTFSTIPSGYSVATLTDGLKEILMGSKYSFNVDTLVFSSGAVDSTSLVSKYTYSQAVDSFPLGGTTITYPKISSACLMVSKTSSTAIDTPLVPEDSAPTYSVKLGGTLYASVPSLSMDTPASTARGVTRDTTAFELPSGWSVSTLGRDSASSLHALYPMGYECISTTEGSFSSLTLSSTEALADGLVAEALADGLVAGDCTITQLPVQSVSSTHVGTPSAYSAVLLEKDSIDGGVCQLRGVGHVRSFNRGRYTVMRSGEYNLYTETAGGVTLAARGYLSEASTEVWTGIAISRTEGGTTDTLGLSIDKSTGAVSVISGSSLSLASSATFPVTLGNLTLSLASGESSSVNDTSDEYILTADDSAGLSLSAGAEVISSIYMFRTELSVAGEGLGGERESTSTGLCGSVCQACTYVTDLGDDASLYEYLSTRYVYDLQNTHYTDEADRVFPGAIMAIPPEAPESLTDTYSSAEISDASSVCTTAYPDESYTIVKEQCMVDYLRLVTSSSDAEHVTVSIQEAEDTLTSLELSSSYTYTHEAEDTLTTLELSSSYAPSPWLAPTPADTLTVSDRVYGMLSGASIDGTDTSGGDEVYGCTRIPKGWSVAPYDTATKEFVLMHPLSTGCVLTLDGDTSQGLTPLTLTACTASLEVETIETIFSYTDSNPDSILDTSDAYTNPDSILDTSDAYTNPDSILDTSDACVSVTGTGRVLIYK
ncbi:hypothetical protein KIPB_005893, partial [Kipferlia bialata]|eukprot:g5893.t1